MRLRTWTCVRVCVVERAKLHQRVDLDLSSSSLSFPLYKRIEAILTASLKLDPITPLFSNFRAVLDLDVCSGLRR